MWILIGLIAIPLIEVRVFALVAAEIGAFPALLLCVLSGIIGSTIVRAEGFRTMLAVHACLLRRELPARTVFDSICRLAAGILLILPGFFSDFLAILLLAPQVQGHLYRVLGRRFDEQGRPRDPHVIEGEFVRVENEKLPRADSDQT